MPQPSKYTSRKDEDVPMGKMVPLRALPTKVSWLLDTSLECPPLNIPKIRPKLLKFNSILYSLITGNIRALNLVFETTTNILQCRDNTEQIHQYWGLGNKEIYMVFLKTIQRRTCMALHFQGRGGEKDFFCPMGRMMETCVRPVFHCFQD